MKHLIPALALSAILTGCIQTAPVKPVVKQVPTPAEEILKSCAKHGRFVLEFYDEADEDDTDEEEEGMVAEDGETLTEAA